MKDRTWTVLIIGGASGIGKSEIAYKIAGYYGISVLEFDDIHIAVKTVAPPDKFPAIADLDGHDWMNRGVEWNVNWLKDVSREMSEVLKRLVERHISDDVPVIIEGDFIIPESIKSLLNSKVKALFIQESEASQIINNFLSREGGEPQSFRAEISVSYNNWIRESCEELGIDTLESRPWDNVLERVIKLLKE